MNPITREEQYLNRLTGEEGIIPDKPVTREEQYFARLCGGDNVIPDKPVTRREQYLATLCGEDVITPTKPVTRIEQYMAFASGESESKPEKPITREEMYWDKYQGGDVPEEKTIAFTDIITVTDALARPAVDLQSEITATQNLNGYEYPWVGGAGKNLIPIPEWFETGYTFTQNGITFKVLADGIFEVSGTNVGTGTTDFYLSLANQSKNPFYLENGTYTISISGHPSVYLIVGGILNGNGYPYRYVANGSVTGTVTDDTKPFDYVVLRINSGIEIPSGTKIYVQFESGETASAWTPYENICAISGRTEVNVTRTGDIDFTASITKNKNINADGTISDTQMRSATIDAIEVEGSKSYSISYTTSCRNGVFFYDTDDNFISFYSWGSAPRTFTTPQNTKYVRFSFDTADTVENALLTYGDTFNTELGRTVYGGTLDLTTGELTITHAYVDLGDLTWTVTYLNVFQVFINEKKVGSTNFITTSYRTVDKGYANLANGEATSISPMSHGHFNTYIGIKDERATTAADFKTLVTGQKMVYELATPQTISLTPTEVQMLENNNTIWADSGRVQLTYLSKAAQRVQTMNASLKANTLKLTKGAVKK